MHSKAEFVRLTGSAYPCLPRQNAEAEVLVKEKI